MEKCIEKEKRNKKDFLVQSQVPNHQFLSPDQKKLSNLLGRFLSQHAEKVGIKTYNFVCLHWLGIVNFPLFLLVGGALVAPYLAYFEQRWMSKIIYDFYSLFCHQKASRSFFLWGNQVAICSRCLAFYCGILVFALWLSIKNTKPLGLRWALILIVPAVTDIFLQILHLRESTNLLRVTTGALLGLALTLYLLPRAQKSMKQLLPFTELDS